MHRFMTSFWLLVMASVGSADVIVVDQVGGAGFDFFNLPAAVATASDGDVLLVRDGVYDPFSLVGKGLVITADAGATVRLLPGLLTVSGVPAGSSVSLSGLQSDVIAMTPAGPAYAPLSVALTANAGSVSLRDCLFSASPDAGAGFFIDGGTRVVMSDCTLLGLTAIGDAPEATLIVEDSELYASRCSFTGLIGVPGAFPSGLSGGPGAAGIIVRDGRAVLDECTVTGGLGGPPFGLFGCGDGGDGGTGLVIEGATSAVILRDSTVVAGLGSQASGAAGSCSDGTDGNPFKWLAGTLTVKPGDARGLAVPSPEREFEPFTLNTTGPDGEQVYALLSLGAQPLFDNGSHLMLYGATPLKVRYLGSLPTAAAVQLVMPAIPTVVEGVAVRMQAAFVDASTQVRTSGGLDVVVLDSAF